MINIFWLIRDEEINIWWNVLEVDTVQQVFAWMLNMVDFQPALTAGKNVN